MAVDRWKDFEGISEEEMKACEKWSCQMIREESTYYSRFRRRKPFFDFGGLSWQDLTDEAQDTYASQRADSHNRILKYTDSFYEKPADPERLCSFSARERRDAYCGDSPVFIGL